MHVQGEDTVRFCLWWLSSLCLFWSTAQAQGLVKTCLNDEGAGEALELAVDAIGDLHLSRILSSSRELVYTLVAPDGSVTNEIITGPVSPFVGDRLSQTDIEVDGASISQHTPAVTIMIHWLGGSTTGLTREGT